MCWVMYLLCVLPLLACRSVNCPRMITVYWQLRGRAVEDTMLSTPSWGTCLCAGVMGAQRRSDAIGGVSICSCPLPRICGRSTLIGMELILLHLKSPTAASMFEVLRGRGHSAATWRPVGAVLRPECYVAHHLPQSRDVPRPSTTTAEPPPTAAQ